MGRMTVSADALDTPVERVNLASIDYHLLGMIEEYINGEVDQFTESFYEDMGVDPNEWCTENGIDFWEEVSWDYAAMFSTVAESFGEYLAEEYPELFGEDGPVTLVAHVSNRPRDGRWGTNHDVVEWAWCIDGKGLAKLFTDVVGGDGTVHDGHGISGFTRTCTDEAWMRHLVVSDTMEALPGGGYWEAMEWLHYRLDGSVTFGKLEEALYAAV